MCEGNPLLWNLMWPTAGLPDGSFYSDNQPNMLDQFLVNKTWPPATPQSRPTLLRRNSSNRQP
jgi:hypothetical protein